jgi:peptidoglycan/xylan/chitin deacetylase (PgdA/CDA1 family)
MPATVVVSLDLELAWGSFDHALGPELLSMARWTHDHGAPALLDLLTRNRLSATWAVVGLVMLERMPEVADLAPVSTPAGRDWFSFVAPGATEAAAPEWLGGSLLERIRRARPEQEIGFHGFSHLALGEGLPPARARQELERCAALAARLGLRSPPFVFPRNQVGHLDELRAAGMGCFRGADELPLPLPGELPRRVWLALGDCLGLPPALVRPRLEGGLVNVPGSLMVRHAGGWRGLIPDAVRLRRLRLGLERVRRRGGVFHVWLHPENLYFGRPRLEAVLSSFFSELADRVAGGGVRVLTLGALAKEIREAAGVREPGPRPGPACALPGSGLP